MLHDILKLVVVFEFVTVVAVQAVGEAEPLLDLALREVTLDHLGSDASELLVAHFLFVLELGSSLALDAVGGG